MKIKWSYDQVIFQSLGYFIVISIGCLTLFPFIVLIGSSFASEHEIITRGYTILPRDFSLDAYKLVFLNPQKIARAYAVTIFIIVLTHFKIFIQFACHSPAVFLEFLITPYILRHFSGQFLVHHRIITPWYFCAL